MPAHLSASLCALGLSQIEFLSDFDMPELFSFQLIRPSLLHCQVPHHAPADHFVFLPIFSPLFSLFTFLVFFIAGKKPTILLFHLVSCR
jgi:hypothetical protein